MMRNIPEILLLCVLFLIFAPTLQADTFDLTGKVVDIEEKAIAGVTVWINQKREVSKTETNETGEFKFSGLTVGYASLVARKDGYALGGSDALIVGPGTITFYMVEAEEVRLRIIDSSKDPIEGARINRMFIGDVFHVYVDDLIDLGFHSYRSDENGWITVPDLPKGSYFSFTVSHRKYANYTMPHLSTGNKLDILLARGVELSGRVKGPEGNGLKGATVIILRADSASQHGRNELLTDPDGFYRTTVSEGNYYVAARHKDYASPPPQNVSVKDLEGNNAPDIVLLKPNHITGTIVDDKANPMGAVKVSYLHNGTGYDSTYSAHDGAYNIIVPKGEGAVQVQPPNGFMTENIMDTRIVISEKDMITVPPIKLKPLPEITGTVVSKDGDPEPNVLISSVGLKPPVWAITDEKGQFSILLDVVPHEAKAEFRVEHALRFLRFDLKVNLKKLKPVEIKLKKTFEPDLHPCDKTKTTNDLDNMRNKPAPEIACDAWFNSEGVKLKDLIGKIVVMTLWGGFANSGPCLDRIIEMNCIADLLRDVDDVFFLTVHDASLEPEEVKEYIDMYGLTLPVGCDADPFLTFDTYNTNTIPQTVIIDKKGVLRYYDVEGRTLELIKSLRRE